MPPLTSRCDFTKRVHGSYCPVLHQFVESFADLGEVGSEGAAGFVQLGQELRVRVMVEDVVDAAVGLGGEVRVDQLQQQIPAAGEELLHHGLVKCKVHLHQARGGGGQMLERYNEAVFYLAKDVTQKGHL